MKDMRREQRFDRESADEIRKKKKKKARSTEVLILIKTETAKISITVNLILNALLKKDVTMISFEVGVCGEVKDNDGGELWGARIVSVEDKQYKTNYDGYDSGILE